MPTITAVIRVRADAADAMATALPEGAAHVRAAEPGTLGFHVCQETRDPRVFTTFECPERSCRG